MLREVADAQVARLGARAGQGGKLAARSFM